MEVSFADAKLQRNNLTGCRLGRGPLGRGLLGRSGQAAVSCRNRSVGLQQTEKPTCRTPHRRSCNGDGKRHHADRVVRRPRALASSCSPTARSWWRAQLSTARTTTSRWRATTPTAASTPASTATARSPPPIGSADDVGYERRAAGRRQDRRGGHTAPTARTTTSRWCATTPTAASTRASTATASVTTPIGSHPTISATSVAVQADGKIVVAGYSINGSELRLRAGALQRRRQPRHQLRRRRQGHHADRRVRRRRLQRRGAGRRQDRGGGLQLSTASNNDFALVRYNADGSLDTSFDGDGKVTTADRRVQRCTATASRCSPTARSWWRATATTARTTTSRWCATTPTAASTRASTATASVTTADRRLRTTLATSVAVQPDGKIVVAGYSYNGID